MLLLVTAHPGCHGQNPENCKIVVCVFLRLISVYCVSFCNLNINTYTCTVFEWVKAPSVFDAFGWKQEWHPAFKSLSGGVLGCWHGCLSGARCRFAYGPADATATHSLSLQ